MGLSVSASGVTGGDSVSYAGWLGSEGLITPQEALQKRRIPADDLNQLLQPIFDPAAKDAAVEENKLLAKGINAGPGAATGQIVFHASDEHELHVVIRNLARNWRRPSA